MDRTMNRLLEALRLRVAGWIRRLSAAPSRREVERATATLRDPIRRPEADEAARQAMRRLDGETPSSDPTLPTE
jgi:hypothetical protein